MKKHVSPLLFSLLILLPISAHGQFPENYISIKPGVYFFTGDLEDDHPVGFFGGVFYGFRLLPKTWSWKVEPGISTTVMTGMIYEEYP